MFAHLDGHCRRHEAPTVAADRPVAARAPFATVADVRAGSPADRAGLRAGDALLAFGDVVAFDVDVIKRWTLTHVNEHFPVVVVRDGSSERTLALKPTAWSGGGLLGCLLAPTEDAGPE